MNTLLRVSSIFLLFELAGVCSLASNASAQVPRTISYQGVLTNSGTAANGKHLITVALYDAMSGGTMLYQESQEITIAEGIFNIEIGSQSPIPLTLAFDLPYYLGVSVDGNAEMTPRIALSAAPYALTANVAELAKGLTPDARGVVTSINELAGPLRITGDSITTVTENGNNITIHARALPGATYTAGQGISITNSVITATGGLPAGTILNSTLRWNGSGWTENPDMMSDINGNTQINGSATLGNGIGVDNITMNPGTGSVKINGFVTGVVKSSPIGVLSSGLVDLSTDVTNVLQVIHGGTGLSNLTSGQLLVGNGSNPVSSTQLTGGTGISISQTPGNITITNTGSIGWGLTGNTGTSAPGNFLGTTDNQAFEIHVYDNDAGSRGSKRVMRYEPNLVSANLIGGYQGNNVTNGVVGAVIAGGGLNGFNNSVTDDFGFVGGGSFNRAGDNTGSTVSANHATVGGGGGNTASATYASVLGGAGNTASGSTSTVGGGTSNQATGAFSTITGGLGNQATDSAAVVGGGGNTAGRFAVVVGGINNLAGGFFSTVSGGVENGITGQRSAIAGGGWLGLGGAGSFGFHNGTSASDSAYVSSAATAFFGNVNLWLGNTNNTPSELRLYSAQNGGVNFPAASTHYSSFQSGIQSADFVYTLPTSQPSGNQVLVAAAVAGSGPYSVTLGWASPSGSGSGWGLTGNSGTTPTTNFLGTTDNQDFVIKTNSSEAIRVTSGGYIGLGITTPVHKLNVVDITGQNPVQFENNNSSTAINNQAAAVLVNRATNAAPTELSFSHFNSSSANLGFASIDMMPNNLTSGSEAGSLVFGTRTNGATNVTEKMRITFDGKVGIGTSAPSQELNVANGNIFLSRTGGNPTDTLQLQGTSTGISSFAAGAQGATTINYTLPIIQPSANQILSATSVSGTGPYAVTLSWVPAGSGSGWGLTGNSGTTDGTSYLGTSDNVAFTIRVNNLRELRIQPSLGTATGSMVGGGLDNTIAATDTGSFIGFGQGNRIAANDATILGGAIDTITSTGNFSVIAGSFSSTVSNEVSGIVGGESNYIASSDAFIGGGYEDSILSSSYAGFIGGGARNVVKDEEGAIVGGIANVAFLNSFVGGGISNYAGSPSHSGAATIGGWHDTVYADDAGIVAGQYNTITLSSLYSAILGGTNNYIGGSNTTIAGGGYLRMTGTNSLGFHAGSSSTDSAYITANSIAYFGNANVWLGNTNNTASQLLFYGPQNGGIAFPSASTHFSSIAAGSQSKDINYTLPTSQPSTNQVLTATAITGSGPYAVTLGWAAAGSSSGWGIIGNSGTSPSTNFAGTTDNQAFEIHVYDGDGANRGSKRVFRFDPTANSPNITGGYQGNSITGGAVGSFIGGGGANGFANSIAASYSTIGGGYYNRILTSSNGYATIGGGFQNYINGGYSIIGGGINNYISGFDNIIGGGELDSIIAGQAFIGGGQANRISGNVSAIPGGSDLTIGTCDFGFNNAGTVFTNTQYAADLTGTTGIAYFGNVDLWLGNTGNYGPRQLRFYENNSAGNFNSANYTAFVAPSSFGSGSIIYTLPSSPATTTGNLLWTTSGNASTMNWTGNLVWDDANSRLGINTTSPLHPVHSVNSGTTDEIAALYGNATASSTNQAIGVWGRANNTSSSNTGTIAVLATGNGNTTAGQTNVALQLNDGEFTMGRTTESPSVGSDVEASTGGTAYTQQGPSGIVELTLGSFGNLQTSAPTAGIIQDLGSVTINNRYAEVGSVVLTNIVAMIYGGSGPNPQNSAFIVNADNTASGSFVVRVKMIPTVTNATNYSTSDKIRIGYVIVNKSK